MTHLGRHCWGILALALAAGAWLAPPASASRIAVAPIRIELGTDANFCALTVSNLGLEKVAVQVRGFAWSQKPDGTDQLDPADIRVNPSVTEVAPGARRLVRCSLPPHGGATESSYRLLVDEIPQGEAPPGTIKAVLRLSIPIFRTPKAAAPALRWQPGPPGAIEISNNGRMHAVVGKLVIHRAGQAPETITRGFYLLAGASRLVVPAQGGAITRIEAVTATGRVEAVAKRQD